VRRPEWQRPRAWERRGRGDQRNGDTWEAIAQFGRPSSGPALLIKLPTPSTPPRVYLLVDDFEQQVEAERVARLLARVLARLPRPQPKALDEAGS